jgi:hypothetical protein
LSSFAAGGGSAFEATAQNNRPRETVAAKLIHDYSVPNPKTEPIQPGGPLIINRYRPLMLGTLVLLSAPKLLAQPTPLHLCTVQPSEGLSSGPAGTQPGWGGFEAKKLAKELSTQKLLDGTPIQAIAIVRKTRKDSETEAQRQDCPFIIELWDHDIGDMADNNGAPYTPNNVDHPNGVPFHGNPIYNGIEWTMTRSDSRKVIARGYLPSQPHYKGQAINRTLPALATQIADKLNRIEKR